MTYLEIKGLSLKIECKLVISGLIEFGAEVILMM